MKRSEKEFRYYGKGFYNASIYFKSCFAKHGNLLSCVHYSTYLEIPILSAGSDILRKWQLNWIMRKNYRLTKRTTEYKYRVKL